MSINSVQVWKGLFFLTLLAYCFYYAPYGINETDGGFLTGLAWQLLSGKTLYTDVVYVRPPMPVWLRTLELILLPEYWAVMGERWLFYGKVALYCWIGASILIPSGAPRWQLGLIGMVLSVHNYPPAAWHTVDGILFAVAGIGLVRLTGWGGAVAGGLLLGLSMLCKQSFYPLIAVPILMYPLLGGKRALLTLGGVALSWGVVLFVLGQQGALAAWWQWTNGAGSVGQIVQHGLIDYFRIDPIVGLPVLLLGLPVAHHLWGRRPSGKKQRLPLVLWSLALIWMAITYCWAVREHADFTLPFAQIRLLAWIATGLTLLEFQKKWITLAEYSVWLALSVVSWCAAISWGYNLPILFALPWVYPVFRVSGRLWRQVFPEASTGIPILIVWVILLAVFRFSASFVYRDGRRAEMSAHLGAVFPALSGIYSSPETQALYQDLKDLASRYPAFKTMPSFPQASFLNRSVPPLPLDWVVRREMNGDETRVRAVWDHKPLVFFVEKAYQDRIRTDPELSLTRELINKGTILEETPHFWVLQLHDPQFSRGQSQQIVQ